jgi:membrane protease YdiL (CAAX protease family)
MKNYRILYETIVMTVLTLTGMVLLPSAKTLFALLPVLYLLIERRIRHRSWGELGFRIKTFWTDLRKNWALFILTGFVIQPVLILWAKQFFPAFLEHVQARLPFETGFSWGVLLPLLAVSLLGEEMTYRALIQSRLIPFIGLWAAVGVTSILFGLAHFAPGPVLVVIVDIGLVILDSILYGIIFARSTNIWVVWLAHLLGDIFGLLVLARG